jgi:hypothetical protein
MRYWLIIASALCASSAGCGNTYHPEYHPQTSVQYSVSTSNPVHVQGGAQAQPVYVTPASAQPQTITVPAPPPPPTPPESFPW